MIHCEQADNIQIAICSGYVTPDELAAFCREWVQHPGHPSLLIDFRKADDFRANASVMSDLSNGCSDGGRTRKIALLADRDVLYGMCRMMEMMHPGPAEQIRAFRERNEAERWVGLRSREASRPA